MKSASACAVLSGIIVSAFKFASPLYAYAPLGHEIVGAIADERLAKTPTAAKVRTLRLQSLLHIPEEMATHEPKNWRLPANIDIKRYAEAWADEILPIAREAHERLQFTSVHPQQEEDRTVAAGEADERLEPDHISYRRWATNVVREELHKAGWRLADLLEKVL